MSAKIFVIGGCTSIEYYGIGTNNFNLLDELEIPAPTF
jgi:hypothetical protein